MRGERRGGRGEWMRWIEIVWGSVAAGVGLGWEVERV